jgi:hypothetical protein
VGVSLEADCGRLGCPEDFAAYRCDISWSSDNNFCFLRWHRYIASIHILDSSPATGKSCSTRVSRWFRPSAESSVFEFGKRARQACAVDADAFHREVFSATVVDLATGTWTQSNAEIA